MNLHQNIVFVTLIVLLLPEYVSPSDDHIISNKHKIKRLRKRASGNAIICNIFSIHHMTLPGTPSIEPTFRCVTDDDRSRDIINIPEKLFYLHPYKSGKTRVSVPASVIEAQSDVASRQDIIDMSAASGTILLDGSRTRRASSIAPAGSLNLAVILVKDDRNPDRNHSPDFTAAELSSNIFGHMVTGFQECSGNKIRFIPATGDNFIDGIMELTITQDVTGLHYQRVEDIVTEKLRTNDFKRSDYSHVMYVFPRKVNFEGNAAYAELGGTLSVVDNQYANKKVVFMHEIGHNLGHHHSGDTSHRSSYGDSTGWMGNRQDWSGNSDRVCFNGAKSWWSNWYSDRHAEATPTSGSMILNMLSIDDYLNNQAKMKDQFTVARIVGATETDLFVMYNRAEGVNSQVEGHRDQVTIVRQGDNGHQSWFEAGLGLDKGNNKVPSQWEKENWDGSGSTLVIRICDVVVGTPDYARVIVYLKNRNDLSCNSTHPQPTLSNGCAAGESELEVGVMNNSPDSNINWSLKTIKEGGRRFRGILFGQDLPRFAYSKETKCIDNSKCYKFNICQNGSGWYHLTLAGEIMKEAHSEAVGCEETNFGTCEKPIVVPTDSPIGAPSSGPCAPSSPTISARDILAILFDTTNGSEWHNSENWGSANECDYFGVACRNGVVIIIHLEKNGLTGSIPSQLGQLIGLQILDISANKITGSIPCQLGELGNLQKMMLNHNQLTGTIPSQLGQLSSLKLLTLRQNDLSGSTPNEVCELNLLFSNGINCF